MDKALVTLHSSHPPPACSLPTRDAECHAPAATLPPHRRHTAAKLPPTHRPATAGTSHTAQHPARTHQVLAISGAGGMRGKQTG